MRWPIASLLVLVLLLAGCAGTAARDVVPSRVFNPDAFEFVARPSCESLPEDHDLQLDVVDVGGGLCVIGVGLERWEILIDAGHWQGEHRAAAADALIPDVGLALAVFSHSDSDHLGGSETLATSGVDTVTWTGRLPFKCQQGLRTPCPAAYPEFVGALSHFVADGPSVISLASTPLVPSSYILGYVGWNS